MEPVAAAPASKSRTNRRVAIAVSWVVAALITFVIISAVWFHSYVVLVPDRSDDEATYGFVFGMVAMITTVSLLLYYRPQLRRGLIVSVSILGFCALLLGTLFGMAMMTSLFKLYDFRERPIIGSDAYLRVSRFYQSHGKGTAYLLVLADFSPRLSLYYDDYRWNTGGREYLAVTGKCIRVHLERSGQALRMTQPEHVHAVPCPVNPKLLQLG